MLYGFIKTLKAEYQAWRNGPEFAKSWIFIQGVGKSIDCHLKAVANEITKYLLNLWFIYRKTRWEVTTITFQRFGKPVWLPSSAISLPRIPGKFFYRFREEVWTAKSFKVILSYI